MQPVQDLLASFRDRLVRGLNERLLCVDVGARWGADSSLMLLRQNAKLLCFDPDAEECARLQKAYPVEDVEYVPLALSADGRDLKLHVTREPACSSIFPPIEALYSAYPALASIEPASVETVPSTSLDLHLARSGLPMPDLIKLDTQGSELDILRGAQNNLERACMIDVEVEFNALYSGQALFSDVDLFLRKHGFALWRLQHLVHYTHGVAPDTCAPAMTVASYFGELRTVHPGYGQLFWGQAHYVRQECLASNTGAIDAQFARRAAAIAGAYGYWDLVQMILEKCPGTRSELDEVRSIFADAAI